MHISIDIEVGNRGKGEIYIRVVGPQVDVEFAIVQRHMHLLGCFLQRLPADDGQGVVGGVRHSWLHHPHHVGERLVVVAHEEIFIGVHLSRAARTGQGVLMLGSLHHLHRRAGIHDALEVADADVSHAGHVIVEAQHHHTLGTVLWIYDGIHTLHVVLHLRLGHIGSHHGVVDTCVTRGHGH